MVMFNLPTTREVIAFPSSDAAETFLGRVAAAILVILMEDVFEARIASGRSSEAKLANKCRRSVEVGSNKGQITAGNACGTDVMLRAAGLARLFPVTAHCRQLYKAIIRTTNPKAEMQHTKQCMNCTF